MTVQLICNRVLVIKKIGYLLITSMFTGGTKLDSTQA